MAWIFAIPLELRLAAFFVVGVCAGSLANWAIYRLAWNPRSISPWSPPPQQPPPQQPAAKGAKHPPRRASDRIPLFGWFGLRRESHLHGAWFWLRPLAIEFLAGVGLAALYWWEVAEQGLYEFRPGLVDVPAWVLHLQFASHALLCALMLVATFIDIDEKTIPDGVTLTGTFLGLILAALAPDSLLGELQIGNLPPAFGNEAVIAPLLAGQPGGPVQAWQELITLTSPMPWPPMLEGTPRWESLAIGLACLWFWCFAFAPRPWYTRHGWGRALRVASARLGRWLRYPQVIAIIAGCSAVVGGVWWLGGAHWAGLLTALVGMAFSGLLVWVVRIIGAATLKKEAMGFGDVLLLMMIGTFVGWQAALMIFFLAPLAGLVIGLGQLILFRDQEIPYGPFLCLATLVVILAWSWLWNGNGRQIFSLGWWLIAILAGAMLAMAAMLFVYQKIKEKIL